MTSKQFEVLPFISFNAGPDVRQILRFALAPNREIVFRAVRFGFHDCPLPRLAAFEQRYFNPATLPSAWMMER